MKKQLFAGWLVGAVLAGLAITTTAEAVTKSISFGKGKTGTSVTGQIKGREDVDYQLRAGAGQTMVVDLKASKGAAYFNVLPPGSSGEAIFVGQNEGNHFKGQLPSDGVYTIRLYLMGAAKDENKAVNYTLEVSVLGSGKGTNAAPSGGGQRESSAARAGQGQFDATGDIPCAQSKGQPMGQCPFGVARDGGGSATVVVTRPDGRKRAIFFEKGKATSADLSQADGNMTFRATKEADLYKIQAGDERYEIPEAVIFGG